VPDEPFNLRVDRDRFVPLASVAIGVAIGMAVVLGVSRVNGRYFVIVSPFYAFLPVLALAYAAVVFGRCRNEYLAAGLAVVVASITYWGQFPAALADEIGPAALVSPRLVAKYVALRMNHESMESTLGMGASVSNRPPERPDPGMNWVFGFAEWGGIMMGSIVLLLYRCRAAYCERCGWWTTRERLALLPKSGSNVREQFETGTLDQLKLFTTRVATATQVVSSFASVDFCQQTGDCGDPCPVFFTVFDSAGLRSFRVPLREGTMPLPAKPNFQKLAWWLLRVPLDEQQIDAVAVLFRKMAAALGRAPAESFVADADLKTRAHAVAVIQQVPAGSARMHVRRWRLGRVALFRVWTAVVASAFAVCLALLMTVMDAVNVDERQKIDFILAACMVVPVLALGVGIYEFLCGGHVRALWQRRAFRKVVHARPDRWVDPSRDSPGGESVFIDVLRDVDPLRPLSGSVTDTGFLQFDADHRQLLFEGNAERYRIPADAIRFCQAESIGQQFHPLIRWTLRPHDLVVLRAATAAGVWQAWFWCRNVRLRPVGRRGRREAAELLASRIVALTNNVVEPLADSTEEDLAYVRSHPPKCLTAFHTSPAVSTGRLDGHGESVNSFFELQCPCGGKEHQVLCYPLVHPDSREVVLVGPIALRCKKCRRTSEIFDAKQHGYNAEHGTTPTRLCGEAERTAFACPHCQAVNFGVVARFEYSSDGLYDDDEGLIARAEDYFTWFTLLGRCAGCSKETHIVEFECA
jgi:hypothetical protein